MCSGDFEEQGLAITAWAFAVAETRDASLFATLATAVQLCMGGFKMQELSNTAWALAKVATSCQKHASLFATSATAA